MNTSSIPAPACPFPRSGSEASEEAISPNWSGKVTTNPRQSQIYPLGNWRESSLKDLPKGSTKTCQIHYGPKEPKPKEAPPAKETWQVKPFSEIISNDGLLSQFRSRLALAEILSDLVTDPPVILLDEKQNLFFYQGYIVHLAPTTFKLMALLARRPGEVVTKEEIYAHLWPDFSSAGSSNPYDRQISDRKRKSIAQIKRAVRDITTQYEDKIEILIKTKRKVGYIHKVIDKDPIT